ncbi:hypothetical protein ACI2L4_10175 [Streptomyces sparsogenes]|uniref:hypothetical protein n=1 Tax=Streptomyces sparsogenes TaxID=67365 RepID=UPI0038513469
MTLLRHLVDEQSWTYEDFNQRYKRAAAELYDETRDPVLRGAEVPEVTYRRWTSGKVQSPARPAPQVLERMFPGCSARQLLAPPANTEAVRDQRTPNESEILMTARDAAAHAGAAASQAVPDISMDQLEEDVVVLAQAYGRTPPFEVYRRAKELLAVAQDILERTQKPRQRQRAYLNAGQAAAVLATACFDLGALGPAAQLARTAALYGQVIEHGPLQAFAQGTLALRAYWEGRPSEAVRLVRAAQQFQGLGDTAVTRLAVIEARAYGHLGNGAAADTAIRRSLEPATGRRDDLHDDIGGEFGFPEDRVAMSNATTYLLLHNADGAEEAADRALALLSAKPVEQRSVAIASQAGIDLAQARLLRRELDGAAAALEPVFPVPAEWRGAGIIERISAVRSELTHPDFQGSSQAASLGDQIEHFCRIAVPQQLGATARLAIEG